jgi:hypothetical protein
MANAKDWETEKRGKRKRERDDEDIERLSQSSQRTTRSQSRSSRGSAGRKSAPARNGVNTIEIGVEVLEPTSNRRRHLALANGNGHIAQAGATLSEYAVSRLGKRQKTSDLNAWSNAGLSPPVVDEARSLLFFFNLQFLQCLHIF